MRAFLGTGLLGSGFVKALLDQGEEVHVWNRTPSKSKALEASGAKAFQAVADAVQDADIVHLTLKDDATVDEVLQMATPGLKPGAIIVDHTTTSAAGAVKRSATWEERGFKYQHAPVFMGPQNARESSGTMLVSGNQDLIAALKPVLSKMTETLINLGPETGKAAGMKLAGNLYLIALTGGIADMLSFAKVSNITMDDLFLLLNQWNPGAAASNRLKKIADGDFSHPSWELDMARKDAGLMINTAESNGVSLQVIPAIAAEMDRLIAAGQGKKDWTIIAKDPVYKK